MSFINIDITNITSGDCIIDEFLASTRIDSNSQHLIANYINNDPNSSLLNLYAFLRNLLTKKQVIEWIPFSQVKNFKKIAEGGFSIIYKAIWSDGIRDLDVAVKKLSNSQNISKYVLNELKSLYYCGDIVGISYGLQVIHRNNFIHRDIHSGNILLSQHWQIGDLGLSQPADNTLSNNEIYGVIPYIAPEIFKGAAFSKESDIYSFGIVMWELTTGCKPYINVEHNVNLIYEIIDGKRPEITRDTPECFANLMKKCWDSDPLKRPTIDEVWASAIKWCQLVDEWIYSGIPLNDPVDSADLDETIKQAEKKRLELIRSEKFGPKYTEKSHPKAVFTSRALSSFISSSRISFNLKQEYITKEYELDINDIQSSSTQNINSDTQNSFNSQHQNVHISRPLRPLSKLITTVTANSSSKRNIKELNIETPNNRKHIKPNNSD
ncbi:unnamed protein product [Rhizophagus irregularis]|nr:unnamed protein product [Rhizophagus irregularis]